MAPHARLTVSSLFAANGFAYANIVPRLPLLKDDLGLSNTSLGVAIAAMPAGALVSGAVAGRSIARAGSDVVASSAMAALGLALCALGVVPSLAMLLVVFAVIGAADSLMDVAMNAQALLVQRDHGRTVISGMHGMWSVGALAGGGVGATCAGVGVPLAAHLAAVGGVVAGGAVVLRPRLMSGRDVLDPSAPPTGVVPSSRRHAALVLVGVLVLLAAAVEDAPSSWGAVFLRSELGASPAGASAAFLSFQGAMVLGRALGDRAVDRFGPVRVAGAGGGLACVGIAVSAIAGHPVTAAIGFAVAGIGASPMFPLAFAAGAASHRTAGHGIAAVASMSRVGFLVAPVGIGAVADAAGLRVGLALASAAAGIVALLAAAMAPPSGAPATSSDQTGSVSG